MVRTQPAEPLPFTSDDKSARLLAVRYLVTRAIRDGDLSDLS